MNQLAQSQIRHLTALPLILHPLTLPTPLAMIEPFRSFTHLVFSLPPFPTLRMISGFFIPPAHTHTHHQHPFSSPRQAAVADGRSHQSVPLDAKSVRDLLGQRAALGRLLAFSRCRLKERESNEIKVLVPFL